ncbi:MAG TPA: response regulator [Puia sp.]|jgi:CheY-like chemotaxis protein
MIARNFLVVDDDCEDTELFTEAVGSVDASVSCLNAEHGKDALDKLNRQVIEKPDIIFLDINMPIMNGWQFLATIKESEALREIPVIMYSTSSQRSDIRSALSAGALCFFTKPDNFQRLKKILQVVLEYMANDKLDQVCEAIQKA